MKIIEQSIEIKTPKRWISEYPKFIEDRGRVCYASESDGSDKSADDFVSRLVRRGHLSVLEHCNLTVRIISSRSVIYEFIRHRHKHAEEEALDRFAISQESTRYIRYDEIEVIKPIWAEDEPEMYKLWCESMERTAVEYRDMIAGGLPPQFAREILNNNSVKSTFDATANLREWREIFKLRADKSAHPQIRMLMYDLLSEVAALLPCVFIDLLIE